jgi:TM2 domain-containing membrane protein YozV
MTTEPVIPPPPMPVHVVAAPIPKSPGIGCILQLFGGMVGAGRFYIGSNGIAIAQLMLTFFGGLTAIFLVGIPILLGVACWAFADAIYIACGMAKDSKGRKVTQ